MPLPDEEAPDQQTPPIGDLFANYDPQGAMGGMFAPAFIRGFAPSEQAVQQWGEGRHLSADQIDASRMPELWRDPRQTGKSPYKGGAIPYNQSFGLDKGTVDPNALRAASMGAAYDPNARRDQIAARIAENQGLMATAGFDPNNPATWVLPKRPKGPIF